MVFSSIGVNSIFVTAKSGEHMDSPEHEQTTHLSEYFHILLKHKWLILVSLILVVASTAFVTLRLRPVYGASCVMIIEKERTTSPLTGKNIEFESLFTQSFSFSTHARLITSRPVIQRVIKDLKLGQLPKQEDLETSPIRSFFSRLKQNVRILLGQPLKELTTIQKQDNLINSIKNKISINPVPDTHLLNISAEDTDPGRARDLANSLAKSFIEFNLENRLNASRNTLSWMSGQLYENQKKLENAEEEFLAFKQREKLFSLEGRQEGITDKIGNLNNIYIQTRNRRVEVGSKLKELARSDGSGIEAQHARTLINNPMIDSLYSQLLQAEIDLSRLSKVYKSKHPKIVQVKTAIENSEQKLRAEIQKEVKNLKAELAFLTEKEIALKKTIDELESDALSTNRKELKYTILQRNVDNHQKLYDILLERIKESTITGDIDVSNIRIAEEAVVPSSPIKPNKRKNLIMGIIFGLMIGIGLAFLQEYFDKSLRTEEDIQNYLGLPVLAVIPQAEKKKDKKHQAPGVKAPHATHAGLSKTDLSSESTYLQDLFFEPNPADFRAAEAYRTLRTNIHFSSMNRRLRSLLVSSTIGAEGKTFTATNIAYFMAQAGESVLMIDADLRKPALSHVVHSQNSVGLAGLLSGIFGTEVRNGSLAEFQIGDLFRLLWMQKKTGILSLIRENEKIELIFYLGKLVDLNWVTRPEDEKLASVLISNRMITREQAKQAFIQQKTTGQKLGFILLNNGFLKKEDLTGPLTIHMMEGLRKALGFSTGNFSFQERAESDFETSAFDPVDFIKIYRQLIIGEEPIAYLKQKISAALVETPIKNLFLLPSGNIPPNPSELLSSDRMSFLLSNLQKRFEVLVIDAPPIMPASDALLIAPHVSGVLLVVKDGAANRDLVSKTVEKLNMAQINILGVVLNNVNIRKAGYYKTYFKNYAKYYTEGA